MMDKHRALEAIAKLMDLEAAVRDAQWKWALAKNALPLDLQPRLDGMLAGLYLNAPPADDGLPKDGMLYDVAPLVRQMAQQLPDVVVAPATCCGECGGSGVVVLDSDGEFTCPQCAGTGDPDHIHPPNEATTEQRRKWAPTQPCQTCKRRIWEWNGQVGAYICGTCRKAREN